jgi:hypothetical protein
VREVSWLRQKCDLHEEAVQQRCNRKVARVFRTERRELATHLDEIKFFVVRLLSQMKLARLSRDEVAAPSMMVRRLRWGGADKGNVRVRKPSPLARGRNHGLELRLMLVLQVNSGTVAEAKDRATVERRD